MNQNDFGNYLTNYAGISQMLKTCSVREMLEQTASLMKIPAKDMEWLTVVECPVEPLDGLFGHVLEELVKHAEHYDWLYERLEDDGSRAVLMELLRYRILPAVSFLNKAGELSGGLDKGGDTFRTLGAAGGEIDAILEAKEYIRESAFALSVCVSHTSSGLWEIPRLLDAIRPGYRFRLRYEIEGGEAQAILYAVMPPAKGEDPVRREGPKRIVALAPYERGWSNAELVKDCGVIPYLFYKNHGCEVTMVSAPMTDYSNLKYMDGVKLLFLPDGRPETKEAYIRQEAQNIDCLMLRRPYPDYLGVVKIYRQCNPTGKIYLPLDANSFFVDRIPWQEGFMRDFMKECQVISASGKAMQRHLNEKWPWVIEHIPNGFYHFGEERKAPVFSEKENIILTAGRLGTEQKGTHVLLEAFAEIAGELPEWELHLAGSVEPEFEPYLEQFRERFPELMEHRIHFLGHIADRETLYEKYAKAKIFALTSAWEGGTPNVIAEALYAGDVTAVTKIDEYQEATDDGRCGGASKIGDPEEFGKLLLRLCRDDRLEEMSRHAHTYACRHYDMERIVDGLYELIFDSDEQLS